MLSNHFKISLSCLLVIALSLFGLFKWIELKVSSATPSASYQNLPQNVKETILFNPVKHTITVTTHTSSRTSYSRTGKITVDNKGNVKVQQTYWGMENEYFIGLGYSNISRAYLGTNLAYYKRFDAFVSLGFPLYNGYVWVQPVVGVSYNFYNNTSIGVGVNPMNVVLSYKPEFVGILSVRF